MTAAGGSFDELYLTDVSIITLATNVRRGIMDKHFASN